MNLEERQEFWNTLAKAKDEHDIADVNSKIIYPQKIYRYRSMSIQTLNAIAENAIYFSTPNRYDDPFDTFVGINRQRITELFEDSQSIKEVRIYNELIFKNFPDDLIYEIQKIMINENLKDVREKLRERIWTACFTERYDNETMWLKYAKNHEGLVLEYSVNDLKGDLKKKSTLLKINHSDKKILQSPFLSLYPVYYSKQFYDATKYALFLTIVYSLEEKKLHDSVKKLVSFDSCKWELEKILLTKKIIHRYDEEWRLILGNKYTIDKKWAPRVIIRPKKIILGLKISDDDKKAILMVAEKAGIENIEQMIINENDEFVAQKI